MSSANGSSASSRFASSSGVKYSASGMVEGYGIGYPAAMSERPMDTTDVQADEDVPAKALGGVTLVIAVVAGAVIVVAMILWVALK